MMDDQSVQASAIAEGAASGDGLAVRARTPGGGLSSQGPTTAGWLVGDGGIIELIRTKDWSATPLGALDSWSDSLRTSVSLILASSFPINLIWGPGAVQIWNKAYSVICGEKHPALFGSDYRECWASAWPAIGTVFDAASAGRTAFLENQPMFLDRHGYLEETWFTFSLSPIRDEDGQIAGLFQPVAETTVGMLSERRTRTLRDLARRVGTARSTAEAVDGATGCLERRRSTCRSQCCFCARARPVRLGWPATQAWSRKRR
jgi:hypothetical protein